MARSARWIRDYFGDLLALLCALGWVLDVKFDVLKSDAEEMVVSSETVTTDALVAADVYMVKRYSSKGTQHHKCMR